jgi:N,N'-diacetyllegionaminate synthase
MAVARKSIVAKDNLKAGSIISRENISIKRPGTGLSPARFEEIEGKILKTDKDKDKQLYLSDIE